MSILDLFHSGTQREGNANHLNKVVLIDVSYFAQRVFHAQFRSGELVDHISMRYTLLFTLLIRLNRFNIKPSTHETILCYDGQNYWKKVYAPYYKCRRKDRKPDGKDWKGFFESMESVRQELSKYYPWMVLKFDDVMWYDKESDRTHINGIEADDVIAVLAKRFSEEGRDVMIMSGDGDFTQLDYLDNITIINFESEVVKAENGCGEFDLIHKIVNGDAKDDIANINMRSNYWETRIEGERQKSAKDLARNCCNVPDPLELLTEEQRLRFDENRKILDFRLIPEGLINSINKKYDEYILNPPEKLYEFLYDLELEGGLIQENLAKMIMDIV